MPIINIGVRKFGADNITFGTGSDTVTDPVTGDQTTIAQVNAQSIPFKSQGTANIDDLINGSKALNLTVRGIEMSATASGLVKNNASGVLSLGGTVSTGDLPSGIPASKIASGTVTDAAFGYINDVTSPVQAQLNTLALNSPNIRYYSNLRNTVTSNTADSLTADIVYLINGSGQSVMVSSVSNVIATGTSGAGGLDAGVIQVNTFYARYLIYNNTTHTLSGLLSLSATAPTLPAGYTFFNRLGWLKTDSGGNLVRTFQSGRRAVYVKQAATDLPLMGTGLAGSGYIANAALSVTGVVPTTACSILVNLAPRNGGIILVAPNANYGTAYSNTTDCPFGGVLTIADVKEIVLETSNIYWFSDGAGSIQCYGWVDNL